MPLTQETELQAYQPASNYSSADDPESTGLRAAVVGLATVNCAGAVSWMLTYLQKLFRHVSLLLAALSDLFGRAPRQSASLLNWET